MSTALEIAREKRKAMKAAGISMKRKTPSEKLEEKPTSLRLAVNAFCWKCTGESRKAVKNCTATTCSLYQVRPYQDGEDVVGEVENSEKVVVE